MPRIAAVLSALVVCGAALAQNYGGTYVARNDQGNPVTLTIQQDASGVVTGSLAGNGVTYLVQAQLISDGILGRASGAGGSMIIAAQLQGSTSLKVMLAEPLPNGDPNLHAATRFVMTRTRAAVQSEAPREAPRTPPATQAQYPANPMAPGVGPGQAAAQAGKDGQLAAFLQGNAWCGFTYNKTTGASRSERVVFHPNGMLTSGSDAQTYSSGAAGSVAGQYRGGDQGRWKVQNGALLLSRDGTNWEPQNLQITRNSSGSPILKADGKEYMVCR